MKPPKCRFCGVEEWRHRCVGQAPVPQEKPKRQRKAYNRQYYRDNRSKNAKKKPAPDHAEAQSDAGSIKAESVES